MNSSTLVEIKKWPITFLLALSILGPRDVAAQKKIKLPPAFCSMAATEFTDEEVTIVEPSTDVKDLVSKIMSHTGLAQNFTVEAYSRFNAEAQILKDGGQNKRYIFYNAEFLRQLRQKAGEWGPVGIIAHEIAHHLQGHTIDYAKSNPTIELEADNYAGYLMAKMGAPLGRAQAGFIAMSSDLAPPGSKHPPRSERVEEVKKGWIKGGGILEDLPSLFDRINRTIGSSELQWRFHQEGALASQEGLTSMPKLSVEGCTMTVAQTVKETTRLSDGGSGLEITFSYTSTIPLGNIDNSRTAVKRNPRERPMDRGSIDQWGIGFVSNKDTRFSVRVTHESSRFETFTSPFVSNWAFVNLGSEEKAKATLKLLQLAITHCQNN